MKNRHWLRLLLVGIVWGALFACPALPLPGGERLGFVGSAAAQQVNIDDFYDELDPYGQWVWHPRFGYVWLPERVSPNWRPYTVGHWEYTDEYGWYWDSKEPYAWAVYHYGRWGYDDDYGWFWVPGDTWAPAWVQWRYSDNYVGWAPIGPRRGGYAYGVPVNYDPPVAESWVFVRPQYMTSRAISHYAVPIFDLDVAFIGATSVYRPEFRGGVVYNYGMPRDRVAQIIGRPIYVQKIYKFDRRDGFDKHGHGNGVNIYAPGVAKGDQPGRGPKRFADNPRDFKPKAKLKDDYKGDLPKGFGQSAKDMKSIAKEDPDAFNRKHDRFDGSGGGKDNDKDRADRNSGRGDQGNDKGKDKDQGKGFGGQGNQDAKGNGQGNQGKDRDKDRDNDKGQAKGTEPPPIQKVIRQQQPVDTEAKGTDNGQGNQGKPKDFGGQGKSKGFGGQGNQDAKGNDQGGRDKDKGQAKGTEPPPIQKVIRQQESVDTEAKGTDQGDNGRGNQGKSKKFGDQGSQDAKGDGQGGNGQGNQGKSKGFGQGGGGQGNQDARGDGQGGNGKSKGFGGQGGGGQGGGQAQGGGSQGGGQAQGGGGGGGGKDKCQKHPEKPECQNPN
jgi:hypothetical protein